MLLGGSGFPAPFWSHNKHGSFSCELPVQNSIGYTLAIFHTSRSLRALVLLISTGNYTMSELGTPRIGEISYRDLAGFHAEGWRDSMPRVGGFSCRGLAERNPSSSFIPRIRVREMQIPSGCVDVRSSAPRAEFGLRSCAPRAISAPRVLHLVQHPTLEVVRLVLRCR